MNADVRHALARLEVAGSELARVASLPSEIGAGIRWNVNGLVWVRVGENEWQSTGDGRPTDLEQARAGGWTAPSTHIASDYGWTLEPPPIDEEAERMHLVIEDDEGKPFLSGCECEIGRDHYATEETP